MSAILKTSLPIQKYFFIFIGLFLLNSQTAMSEEFTKIYSSCFGLTLDKCSIRTNLGASSLQACGKMASDTGGNAIGYLNGSTNNNCRIFECKIQRNAIQYSLKVEQPGWNLYIQSSAKREPVVIFHDNTLKYVGDTLLAIFEMFGPAIEIAKSYQVSFISSILKTVVHVLAESDKSYEHIRENVLRDIRDELNKDAVFSMSVRIKDMLRSAERLLLRIGTTDTKLNDWGIVNGMVSLKRDVTGKFLHIDHETRNVFNEELISLQTVVVNARADFVLPQQRYLSLAYYREYAFTHLMLLTMLQVTSVSKTLKESFANESQTYASLHRDYILAAVEEAVWEVEKNREEVLHKDLCFTYPYHYHQLEQSISLNQRMQCTRQELSKLYGVDILDKISNNGKPTSYKDTLKVRNHDRISLLYANPQLSDEDLWMSCDAETNGKCSFTNCPKFGAAFQQDCRQHFVCPGVMFQIHAVDRAPGDLIHSHDKIILYRVDDNENKFYLKDCDDCDVTMNVNQTSDKEFFLFAPGKNPSDHLMDRDVVAIESKKSQHVTRRKSTSWFFSGKSLKNEDAIRIQDPEGCDYEYSWIIHRLGSATDNFIHNDPECDPYPVHSQTADDHKTSSTLCSWFGFC